MTITKIGAGVGIMLLAAIGAFATKAPKTTYFYETGISGNPCASADFAINCNTGANACLGPSGSVADGEQLYASENSSTGLCQTPLTKTP